MSADRRAAVLGHPVAHSLSPALHRAAYRYLGLDWSYEAVDVDVDGLAAFVDGLDEVWVGLSLTMPLKEAVLPLLTDVEPEAATLRSVNTVLLGPDGGRRGVNTDVTGLERVLAEAAAPRGTPVTVLGGGATARSALAALARHGVAAVTVCVRRREAGEELVAIGSTMGLAVEWVPYGRAADRLGVPVVVTTVPAAAAGSLADVVPASPGLLVDVLYDPWPTPLARAWASRGAPVVGGLPMLVHQAAEQVRLMTGRDVPVEVLRSAGEQALASRA